ncbi:MAG: replication restart helicase PriA [Chthoniobacterales bacterium]
MPRIVRVLLDQSAGKSLDYLLPEHLAAGVEAGSRVRVPLRSRVVLATVVEMLDSSPFDGLKEVASVHGERPMVRPNLLKLAHWIADYYCCPSEQAVRSVLPVVIRDAKVRHKEKSVVRLVRTPTDAERQRIERAPKQCELLRILQSAPALTADLAGLDTFRPAARALERLGCVAVEKVRVERDPEGAYLPSPELDLNSEQSAVLQVVKAAIENPTHTKPILLHGVTGSGKTEVYLQAIRHTLALGKTALVMVPEISLTPQTVERFKSRFAAVQSEVAVTHSHLSDGERHDEWHKIHSGRARIVIGARSAVFAPLDRLGLIVVDEEHEGSYKQEEAPRYHGRDVAVMRAAIESCAILLGSATPSLESFHNAIIGKYSLVRMPSRIDDRQMPLIRVVDMRHQNRRGGQTPALSPMLVAAISKRLTEGRQTILFLNRRGYASALLCGACGHVCHCPNCSVALTYHRDDERLRCHLCGHSERVPNKCPSCKDPGIRQTGMGTQKIEESIRKVFPKARVARMDADAMSRKGSFRETLDRFKTGAIDILIGTQMIAKGLHFPNVTLVGIINADVSLHVADFRAGERTFQLLTQVAGRAGRGEFEGEVLVQTFTPASPSIQFARHHDFNGFWEQESEFRRGFGYPPFARMVLITVRGVREEMAKLTCETLHRYLKRDLPADTVIGEPSPAPIAKVKTFHRFQIALRGASTLRMTRVIKPAIQALTLPTDVHIAVDVDAQYLL